MQRIGEIWRRGFGGKVFVGCGGCLSILLLIALCTAVGAAINGGTKTASTSSSVAVAAPTTAVVNQATPTTAAVVADVAVVGCAANRRTRTNPGTGTDRRPNRNARAHGSPNRCRFAKGRRGYESWGRSMEVPRSERRRQHAQVRQRIHQTEGDGRQVAPRQI